MICDRELVYQNQHILHAFDIAAGATAKATANCRFGDIALISHRVTCPFKSSVQRESNGSKTFKPSTQTWYLFQLDAGVPHGGLLQPCSSAPLPSVIGMPGRWPGAKEMESWNAV
jgi:hypothetical protein